MHRLIVACAGLFVIGLMTKTGWMVYFKVLWAAFVTLRALFIIGFVFGLINSPQAYEQFGFTPISLLVGKHIYEKPVKKAEAKPVNNKSVKKTEKQVAKK